MPRLTTHRLWARLRETSGANLIETTLILPMMMLVVFAIMEFGTIFYVQMALQNGVSQATRYAITRSVISGQTREQSIKAILRQETPTLAIDDANITFSHRSLNGNSWVNGTGPANSIERVTVTYSYQIMTPFLRPFFASDTITLSAESAMKNEGDLQL